MAPDGLSSSASDLSQALVLQRTSKPFLKAVWFLEGLIQWCNRGGYRGKGLVRVKQYQTIMSGEKRSANSIHDYSCILFSLCTQQMQCSTRLLDLNGHSFTRMVRTCAGSSLPVIPFLEVAQQQANKQFDVQQNTKEASFNLLHTLLPHPGELLMHTPTIT